MLHVFNHSIIQSFFHSFIHSSIQPSINIEKNMKRSWANTVFKWTLNIITFYMDIVSSISTCGLIVSSQFTFTPFPGQWWRVYFDEGFWDDWLSLLAQNEATSLNRHNCLCVSKPDREITDRRTVGLTAAPAWRMLTSTSWLVAYFLTNTVPG